MHCFKRQNQTRAFFPGGIEVVLVLHFREKPFGWFSHNQCARCIDKIQFKALFSMLLDVRVMSKYARANSFLILTCLSPTFGPYLASTTAL